MEMTENYFMWTKLFSEWKKYIYKLIAEKDKWKKEKQGIDFFTLSGNIQNKNKTTSKCQFSGMMAS